MTFKTPLSLFKYLLEQDEAAMHAKLDAMETPLTFSKQEVRALIDAHYQNQNQTNIGRIISEQSDTLLQNSDNVDMIGTQLGVFRLVKKIGEGGMGAVYLGERIDGVISQKVAIKVIHPNVLLVGTDELLQREAQHLADLQHNNIASIIDFSRTDNDVPYLVMEYVDGVNIVDHCRNNQLTFATRLRLFTDVCNAVETAHQNLIIHCDIKPSNILVDKTDCPKLLDFGISSHLDNKHKEYAQTQFVKASTKKYSSPEQLNGKKLTILSDVFSLCKLLQDIMSDVQDIEVEAIIDRGTSTVPSDRFSTVSQLSQQIKNRINNLPVDAYSQSRFYRFKKRIMRNKLSSALVVSVLAIAVITAYKGLSDYQEIVQQTQKYNAMNTFLVDLLRSANPENKQKSEVLVSELIEHGYQDIYEQDLVAEVKTTLLYNLTKAYQYLGDYEDYISKSKEALAYIIETDPANYPYIHLFNAMVGVAYEENSEFSTALEYYYESLQVAEKHNDEKYISNALHQIGNASFELGDYHTAISSFERSIDLLDNESPKYDRDMAISLNSLGIAYSRDNKNKEAIEIYQKSLMHAERHYGPKHTTTLQRKIHIAMEHTALNQCDLALKTFEEVEPIYESVLQRESRRWLSFYEAKAKAMRCLTRYQEALKLHQNSMRIVRSNWNEGNYYSGVVQANIGVTYLESGDTSAAKLNLQQARVILAATVGEDHVRFKEVIDYLAEANKKNRNK